MITRRYRVLRPLRIHGRIAATGEIFRLPAYAVAEYVDSGHLVEMIDVMPPINGTQHVAKAVPGTR